MRHALVLAGGSGTRLWPYSTGALPKQIVPLLEDRSLLQIAVERAASVVPDGSVWLAAGDRLGTFVDVVDGLAPERVIVEPSARDTLPAVALGCAVIAEQDPDAVVAVLTADHVIEPLEDFVSTLDAGLRLAESRDDVLVTFGVVPDHPATGFGYLELADALDPGPARVVSTYREKPSDEVAAAFVAAGPERYLWNSGMFVWRAATLLRAVDAFEPATAAAVRSMAAAHGTSSWAEAAVAWHSTRRVSIDYAVMEPASSAADLVVAALPLGTRWLDVGSWPALGDALGRDSHGNAIAAARAVVLDSEGCVIASSDPGHLVTVVGCRNLVVVHTPGATLVVPAEHAQRVKELHGIVAQQWPTLS